MIRAGQDFIAKLSTGQWTVVVTPIYGVACDGPSIVITPENMDQRSYLNTCCHEALHASQPDLTEREVRIMADDITEILWKRGYRLPRQKKVVDND